MPLVDAAGLFIGFEFRGLEERRLPCRLNNRGQPCKPTLRGLAVPLVRLLIEVEDAPAQGGVQVDELPPALNGSAGRDKGRLPLRLVMTVVQQPEMLQQGAAIKTAAMDPGC